MGNIPTQLNRVQLERSGKISDYYFTGGTNRGVKTISAQLVAHIMLNDTEYHLIPYIIMYIFHFRYLKKKWPILYPNYAGFSATVVISDTKICNDQFI